MITFILVWGGSGMVGIILVILSVYVERSSIKNFREITIMDLLWMLFYCILGGIGFAFGLWTLIISILDNFISFKWFRYKPFKKKDS
jgi:hypothetical protein